MTSERHVDAWIVRALARPVGTWILERNLYDVSFVCMPRMMAYAAGTDLTSECPEVNSSVRRLYNLPLGDLKEFSTTMANNINDLPAISPHGSDFAHNEEILGLASDPRATCGTAMAHGDRCC